MVDYTASRVRQMNRTNIVDRFNHKWIVPYDPASVRSWYVSIGRSAFSYIFFLVVCMSWLFKYIKKHFLDSIISEEYSKYNQSRHPLVSLTGARVKIETGTNLDSKPVNSWSKLSISLIETHLMFLIRFIFLFRCKWYIVWWKSKSLECK